MALAGGSDGLDLVRIMLREAKDHLNPGGLMVVEIGHNREVLEAAFPQTPFTWLETDTGVTSSFSCCATTNCLKAHHFARVHDKTKLPRASSGTHRLMVFCTSRIPISDRTGSLQFPRRLQTTPWQTEQH